MIKGADDRVSTCGRTGLIVSVTCLHNNPTVQGLVPVNLSARLPTACSGTHKTLSELNQTAMILCLFLSLRETADKVVSLTSSASGPWFAGSVQMELMDTRKDCPLKATVCGADVHGTVQDERGREASPAAVYGMRKRRSMF